MDIMNYYVSGITANGYISYLDNNLVGIEKVFVVTGDVDYTALVDKISSYWVKENYSLEYLHNPFYNGSLEAIINQSLSIAIVFNINPHMPINLKVSNIVEIIDLNKANDIDKINLLNDSLLQLKLNKFHCNQSAYLYFAKALKVHDEWEKIYISNMNFKAVDELTDKLINLLVGDIHRDKKAIVKHRFLGAATPEGAIDFIPNLTQNINKRYFIKGRPGSGKSTILKKIANNAIDKGYDVEIYHCGFDHNSLDMLIMRELDVCIFDSTAPHEHFPKRPNDEIIDVYNEAITYGTDEKYEEELNDIVNRYRSNIRIATSYLKTMKTIDEEFLKYYRGYTNKSILEDISNKLLESLH